MAFTPRTRRLARRTFLAGIGGTAIALPLLDIMGPKLASAADSRGRFVAMYGGTSTGARVAPSGLGRGYEVGTALRPLQARDLLGDVSVVSNLQIPWGPRSSVPVGGTFEDVDHGGSHSPLLSGTPPQDGSMGWQRRSTCMGPTSDALVVARRESDAPIDSLEYRIQAAGYASGGNSPSDHMSFSASGAPNAPTVSLRVAYDALFSSYVPTDPADRIAREAELLRGRSVIDLVGDRTERLTARLGANDKMRMDQHLTHIRSLETRLDSNPESGAVCMLPDRPTDPAVSDGGAGWGGETRRGQVLGDLLAVALSCDLTRVATLMVSSVQTSMGADSAIGIADTFHALSHGGGPGGPEDFLRGVAWHVDHFAYLAQKLKSMPEGDGTVLDNTALSYVPEHGWGFDPSTGNMNAHSPTNYVVLLAGRVGGLAAGQHIDGAERHPAQVLVSAMNAVGAPGGLGQVTEDIPELFT